MSGAFCESPTQCISTIFPSFAKGVLPYSVCTVYMQRPAKRQMYNRALTPLAMQDFSGEVRLSTNALFPQLKLTAPGRTNPPPLLQLIQLGKTPIVVVSLALGFCGCACGTL